MTKASFLWIAGIAVISVKLDAQQNGTMDTLAVVGPTVITVYDLLERIELMPWKDKDADQGPQRGLASLVAEKLLSLGARESNIVLEPAIQASLRTIERLAVRDELYRQEVSAKVRLTHAEIADGMRKLMRSLDLRILHVASKEDGDSLHRTLEESPNPDSTLQEVAPMLVTSQSSVQASFGELDSDIENAAYKLRELHSSSPVRTPDSGWAVMYLRSATPGSVKASLPVSDRKQRVERVLRQQKENQILKIYMGNVLSAHTGRVDTSLFNLVAASMRQILASSSKGTRSKKPIELSAENIDSTRSALEHDLGRTLVYIGEEKMSVEDALEEFRYHSLKFSTLERSAFRKQLNAALRMVVGADIMTREAYRKNLQQSQRVRHDVNMWHDWLLARSLFRRLTDSIRVSEDQVAVYLSRNGGNAALQYEVNVREVLLSDPGDAADVLHDLRGGALLEDLARERSLRKAWAIQDGESGFFRVYDRPKIGFAALVSDEGSIVGPLSLPEGYSVFRVIGKRKERPGVEDVSDLLERTKRTLTSALRKSIIERTVTDLSLRHGVTFQHKSLAKVKVSTTSMVTQRSIGFGGTIQAAPILAPMWEWARETEGKTSIVP